MPRVPRMNLTSWQCALEHVKKQLNIFSLIFGCYYVQTARPHYKIFPAVIWSSGSKVSLSFQARGGWSSEAWSGWSSEVRDTWSSEVTDSVSSEARDSWSSAGRDSWSSEARDSPPKEALEELADSGFWAAPGACDGKTLEVAGACDCGSWAILEALDGGLLTDLGAPDAGTVEGSGACDVTCGAWLGDCGRLTPVFDFRAWPPRVPSAPVPGQQEASHVQNLMHCQ
jgi:hypothetical protein